MGNRQRRSSEDSAREAQIRSLRLEQLLCRELNSILNDEVTDSILESVEFKRVELSRDGSRARIWFAFRGGSFAERAAITAVRLQRASGFFRSRLCDALPLKRMPELRFSYDGDGWDW
jgi:ribosome-binding factor A